MSSTTDLSSGRQPNARVEPDVGGDAEVGQASNETRTCAMWRGLRPSGPCGFIARLPGEWSCMRRKLYPACTRTWSRGCQLTASSPPYVSPSIMFVKKAGATTCGPGAASGNGAPGSERVRLS